MQNIFNVRLIFALVVSTILIMSLFVGVRFHLSQLEFERTLDVQVQQTASRIASAVKPSIWTIYSKSVERSFSDEFASGVLDAELLGENIIAIVVYSQFGHIYMGKSKGLDGTSTSYKSADRERLLSQADIIKSYPIRLDAMTLGKVELFIDTAIFERNQRDVLLLEALQISIVSIFIVLVLFYAIKRVLLVPMARLQVARKTFESMSEAVAFTHEDGLIYDSNPAFWQIIQQNETSLIKKSINDFFPNQLDAFMLSLSKDKASISWTGEVECHYLPDKIMPVLLTITQIESTDHKQGGNEYVFVFQDISDRKEAEESLTQLAFFDGLTGLANRQYFENELEISIKIAIRESQKIGLIFIDLDNFKHINDSLGHDIGDKVLIESAKRLEKNIREADFLSRIGGDEFTIIVRNIIDSDCLANLARDLINVFSEPVVIDGIDCKIGASLGLSIFPDDASSRLKLIKHADIAMYNAKDLGKERFSFFSEELNEKVKYNFSLRNKIEVAIKNQEFRLYFQPKVDLFENKIVSAEGLIRWKTLNGEVIQPDAFIPIAEESRQIIRIGRWVIEEAVAQLEKWSDTQYSQLALSINLSPIQLYDEDLISHLKAVLDKHKINPKQLEIEITESAIFHDTESAVKILNEIKKLGMKLSLDDFGTGYSSLSYLQILPVDILKIDRSFIVGAHSENVSGRILNTIIQLAGSLEMEVVAEGIEDEQHLQLLKSQGCRLGQGYYYSPPVTVEEFEKLELISLKQFS